MRLRKTDLNRMSVEQLVNLYLLCSESGDKRSMRLIEWKFDQSVSIDVLID